MAKTVGILGTGDVGKALAAGFLTIGWDVKMGTRDPQSEKVQTWVKSAGAHASAGTFAEAAGFGDVLVLCTAWTGAESAIQLAGPDRFAGKVVIDATNPLDFSGGGMPTLSVAGLDSAGERVQRWLPQARVVKAWNYIGNAHMFRPSFKTGKPDLFLAGNDTEAKRTVGEIGQSFGWPAPVDLGGIESARYLEALAMVWIVNYFRTRDGNNALAFVRK
jgi:predicted dinucleotide-binding enzyme